MQSVLSVFYFYHLIIIVQLNAIIVFMFLFNADMIYNVSLKLIIVSFRFIIIPLMIIIIYNTIILISYKS